MPPAQRRSLTGTPRVLLVSPCHRPPRRTQTSSRALVLPGVIPCTRQRNVNPPASFTYSRHMFSDRLLSIFEMMAARERSGTERGLLCAVATEITGVSAAAIALCADDLPLTRFCASDAMARSLMDLEMTVGEGPCSESLGGDVMVNQVDLESTSSARWIFYTPQALALGARATFAFPVRIGVIRLGVLCLYSETPGELSDEQMTDALLMASVVGRGIVALQAGARPESLSQELQNEATFDFSVHQAAGMVAVQAAISISNALIALRMHAFSTTRSLSNVAARVINRTLRFDFTRQEWIEETQ